VPRPAPSERPRRRGRPPKELDRRQIAEAVERILERDGADGVSVERAATELSVSRTTLYRTVPTKQHLLGLVFEKLTADLLASALAATEAPGRPPGERLHALMSIHIGAAVRMREYLMVFFDGGDLPADVYANWHRWRHRYEEVWRETVSAAMDDGTLRQGDVAVATRLVLGMCIWTSRWYRPERDPDADRIADLAFSLLDQRSTDPQRRTP